MRTIGLVAATKEESSALLRRVAHSKPVKIDHLPLHLFSVGGNHCVLITSGMGVKRAGKATHTLLKHYRPKLLISYGIAGAAKPDLEIGDVVLPVACCELQEEYIREKYPLAQWPEIVRDRITHAIAGQGFHVFMGTAITTGSNQAKSAMLENIQHPIFEMETSGISLVAAGAGIPLFSIRAISDGPRAPIPVDLGKVMDENANLKPGMLIRELLHHPTLIFEGHRMLLNSRLAAENATIALMVVLSMLSF